MISQVALLKIFGLPMVAYGGMSTLVLIFITGYVGHTLMKGQQKFSLKTHKNLFWVTFTLGVMHGIAGLSIYLNF